MNALALPAETESCMNADVGKITINGVVYVPEGTQQAAAVNTDGLKYCIVRSARAGVHAGWVSKRNGMEVTVLCARRLWYWSGAASLSQLAVDGVSNPDGCKFPCEVSSVDVTEAIEVIPCTEKARKSIAEVPIWRA